MTVDVIIPWRDTGCEYRKKSLEFIFNLYSKNFSVTLSDSPGKEFNRAAARNSGVFASKADIVVVTDADLFVPVSQISRAISEASKQSAQIRPFSEFGHMGEMATRYFMDSGPYTEITKDQFETLSVLWPGIHGGTFVMRRDLWLKVGGMDENFVGWGGEDNAFNIRCQSRLGSSLTVLDGYALHMFHPYRRRMSRDNALLLLEYQQGDKS